ncbi:MAG TPA: rhomboid family intramembrane serine protease [Candidatus Mediterraneibacter norwichensis]|nr:rhomboid family intramembrane serine protease [Candidatus Mediterraneibacter norwichensis]
MKKRPEAVCTVALIVINVAVFLILSAMGDTEDAVFMMNHGGMYEPLIVQEHEYYRLFTSMFLHFGMSHLLNNMVLLGALGWNLELETGKIKFLIIYLVSGLGGNLLSLYYDQSLPLGERAVSAGASGAIFGLMGALLYVVIANRGRLGRLSGRGMLFMIALSLYYGLTSTGVDNWAHIGGLVCGFILSVILYRPGRTYGSYGKSYGENGSRFV